MDSFSKKLQDGGIANSTGPRSSDFSKRSLVITLEDQLKAERATAVVLRVENYRLSVKLEATESRLEHYRENHEKFVKMLNTWNEHRQLQVCPLVV